MFDEHGGDQAMIEASLGKMPTTLVRRLISAFTRSRGLVDHSLVQCGDGKAEKARRSSPASASLSATSGNWARRVADDLVELGADVAAVGLGEDRADGGRHHLGLGPRDTGQGVSQEVDPAPLPGRSHEDLGDGLFQPQVVIGDHELHLSEALGPAGLQKGRPKGPVLGVAHVDAQDLSVPGGRHTGDHHHCPRDHPALHPALHVGGVTEQIGEPHVSEGPGAERLRGPCRARCRCG